MVATQLAGLTLTLLLASDPTRPQTPSVRVLSDESPVWLQPDSTSPRIATLKRGTILDVERREGDWYAIVLPGTADGVRLRGFVLASAVDVVDSPDIRARPAATSQAGVRQPIVAGVSDSIPPEPYSLAKQGMYVGYRYTQSRHAGAGDFDGDHFVRYEGAISVIPRLHQGPGMDLVFGYRRFKSSVELRYLRSTHDGTWAGLSGTAVYHTLDSNWKIHLLPGHRVQPFLSLEVGFPWLQVEDGLLPSTPRASARDAALSGIGAGGGAGVTVYPHPRVGLSVGVAYRYDFFLWNRSEGGEWIEIDSTVAGKGLRLNSGVTFTF